MSDAQGVVRQVSDQQTVLGDEADLTDAQEGMQVSEQQTAEGDVTVDVESCPMGLLAGSVLCRASVLPAVLYRHTGHVDVADDVTVYRQVLADHEPAGQKFLLS